MLINNISSYEKEICCDFTNRWRLYCLEHWQEDIEKYCEENIRQEWINNILNMRSAPKEKVRDFVVNNNNFFYAWNTYDFCMMFVVR